MFSVWQFVEVQKSERMLPTRFESFVSLFVVLISMFSYHDSLSRSGIASFYRANLLDSESQVTEKSNDYINPTDLWVGYTLRQVGS
jgi:hypothetical protein